MSVIQELYQFFEQELENCFTRQEKQNIWRAVKEDIVMVTMPMEAGSKAYLQMKATLKEIADNLCNGVPLQYASAHTYFYGLKLRTDRRALIPRPETEELTDWVITDIKQRREVPHKLLDIGTGTGCIAIAIRANTNIQEIYGIDISTEAIALAKENAACHNVSISFLEANILEWEKNFLNNKKWDIIVSNPPYIPYRERHLVDASVLSHEPSIALFVSDDDPLLFYRRIMQYATGHLYPGAAIYFECNEYNAPELEYLASSMGFVEIQIRKDMQHKQRMIKMCHPE